MSGDHSGHSHDHTAGASSKMLAITLGLTSAFLIAELIGSYIFNSLALLSDAAHMFTDSAALAIALAAVRIGQRPADDARTFGYRRFEILAAAFNALLLFAVAGYVLYEGIARFFEPAEVQSKGMLIVAAIGLVVNIIAMRLLSAGRCVPEPLIRSGFAFSTISPVRLIWPASQRCERPTMQCPVCGAGPF